MSYNGCMRKAFLLVVPLLIMFASCDKPGADTSAKNSGAALKSFLESSNKPAVLKFYASWCGSCKHYVPAYEEVKKSMSGTVDFYEIDVDASATKSVVKELRVSRIPETVFVSKDRATINRKLGPLSAADLSAEVNKLKAQ